MGTGYGRLVRFQQCYMLYPRGRGGREAYGAALETRNLSSHPVISYLLQCCAVPSFRGCLYLESRPVPPDAFTYVVKNVVNLS